MATTSRVGKVTKGGRQRPAKTARRLPGQASAISNSQFAIDCALAELARTGKLTGANSEKISVRIDPGLMKAAAERLGLPHDAITHVVNAALALAAAPDPFKVWLRETTDRLPDDFELAV
jgi:hypothetical protein